jgi:hypothetical protein
LAKQVLGRILTEPTIIDSREWIAYFAEHSIAAVSQRLVETQHLHPTRRSRLFAKHPNTFHPTEPSRAAWRSMRIRDALMNRNPMSWPDVALVGFLSATGFLETVLWGTSMATTQEYASAAITQFHKHSPGVHELIIQVQALAGDAVLSHRA